MDDMLGSDDEDKHDAYLERMKREGQEVDSGDDGSGSSDGEYPIVNTVHYSPLKYFYFSVTRMSFFQFEFINISLMQSVGNICNLSVPKICLSCIGF